ncbi:MAG: ZIP family metal transporter [Actinomycetota bacterium]
MDAGTWIASIGAVLGVSSLSGVGALTLFFKRHILQRVLLLLVSFAAGALLGDTFLHLIPEITETDIGFDLVASFSILGGMLAFFILEKVLHWHHAHMPHEDVIHPIAASNLVGDALHNFLDGAIVAGAFIADPALGVATTIAVALHEIPQELGDFSILLHSGMEPKKALRLNVASSLVALAGAVVALTIASTADLERFLLPFSAGAFIYIASTDLIPELHKEPEPVKSLMQATALIAGVAVMAALLWLE